MTVVVQLGNGYPRKEALAGVYHHCTPSYDGRGRSATSEAMTEGGVRDPRTGNQSTSSSIPLQRTVMVAGSS